jgi:hypothetical protein
MWDARRLVMPVSSSHGRLVGWWLLVAVGLLVVVAPCKPNKTTHAFRVLVPKSFVEINF